MNHKAPDYRLVVNGQDITPKVNGRLIDLTVSTKRGDEADTLSITLSDHDGALEIPPKGAEIQVAFGWRGQPLEEKGLFTVDDASFSGPPDVISISARAADMRGDLPTRKTRSWHQTNVGDLVATIADNHSLEPVIGSALAGRTIEHLDQTDESDLNLVTRLAEQHDAIATVKSGRLLFLPKGQAETVSGQAMPLITITPGDGDGYNYSEKDRDNYTGVVAYYNDLDAGEQKPVQAGTDERTKRLRGTYANQQEANAAAVAELNRIKRGEAEFSITLATGRPDIGPEFRMRVQGLKRQINEREWVVVSVAHSVSDSGLVSSLEAETGNG
ncbi:contractile injection system protein, VgrG/Pvc8 family [Marinobacter oulmenensis]|uniref:Late control protein n=1 Tax=Marinobacter oulmenensis TaxID=643747 RepID=A0A840UI14_9GAMM|nr:contractile injection system protein, VgrG/Pvc8 family [Marinobacter oulmenensis]MBB5320457.1 hypothetical protein [Marinobacter oulmenensis]